MKVKIQSILLVFVFLATTTLLIVNWVNQTEYLSILAMAVLIYILIAGGAESISEFSAGHIKLKREVKAAEQARDETEKIRDELRKITKLSTENAYIVGMESMLALGGDTPARERMEHNLDELTALLDDKDRNQDKWWNELKALFPDRFKK